MDETTNGGVGMNQDFYRGSLTMLAPMDMEKEKEVWELWNQDSDYLRLLDDTPAIQFSAAMIREWFEKDDPRSSLFGIYTLENNKLIGFTELGGYDWVSRNAWVAIGIGDVDYRGKGYGTDAMNTLLKFAFRVQNLHRVNLGVFSFNERAVKCYEKCGFKYEGTIREFIYKDDKRWDGMNMGILQSEWETRQSLAE